MYLNNIIEIIIISHFPFQVSVTSPMQRQSPAKAVAKAKTLFSKEGSTVRCKLIRKPNDGQNVTVVVY